MILTTLERYRTKLSQLMGLAFFVTFTFSYKKLEVLSPLLTGSMFVSGCLMVGLATVGRLWCAQYIAGYKTNRLITEGPYAISRNPLYFFSFIGGLGVGLCTESLTLTLTILLVFSLLYPFIIHAEEKKLAGIFGKTFENYFASTPRFFPKPSLFREPQEYTVHPKIFRREVFDALWFVWIVGILEFVETLIELGFISPFFSIY